MASKSQSRQMYVCQQCGSESPKWQGRCPDCGEWNSFTEITVTPAVSVSAQGRVKPGGRDVVNRPVALTEVQSDQYPRLVVPGEEFNRVLGGGIVPGSLVLIGGDPGNQGQPTIAGDWLVWQNDSGPAAGRLSATALAAAFTHPSP